MFCRKTGKTARTLFKSRLLSNRNKAFGIRNIPSSVGSKLGLFENAMLARNLSFSNHNDKNKENDILRGKEMTPTSERLTLKSFLVNVRPSAPKTHKSLVSQLFKVDTKSVDQKRENDYSSQGNLTQNMIQEVGYEESPLKKVNSKISFLIGRKAIETAELKKLLTIYRDNPLDLNNLLRILEIYNSSSYYKADRVEFLRTLNSLKKRGHLDFDLKNGLESYLKGGQVDEKQEQLVQKINEHLYQIEREVI